MERTGVTFASMVLAIFVMGCSELAAPEGRTEKGIIEWEPEQHTMSAAVVGRQTSDIPTDGEIEVITAPAEVVVGEEFNATITTVGLNGCWSSDGATTEVDGLLASITPWDLPPADDAVCTLALVGLPREIALRFDEVGDGVIRVFGRKVVGRDLQGATDVIAEQVVRVVAGSP